MRVAVVVGLENFRESKVEGATQSQHEDSLICVVREFDVRCVVAVLPSPPLDL